jgi:hypothetical protein
MDIVGRSSIYGNRHFTLSRNPAEATRAALTYRTAKAPLPLTKAHAGFYYLFSDSPPKVFIG